MTEEKFQELERLDETLMLAGLDLKAASAMTNETEFGWYIVLPRFITARARARAARYQMGLDQWAARYAR